MQNWNTWGNLLMNEWTYLPHSFRSSKVKNGQPHCFGRQWGQQMVMAPAGAHKRRQATVHRKRVGKSNSGFYNSLLSTKEETTRELPGGQKRTASWPWWPKGLPQTPPWKGSKTWDGHLGEEGFDTWASGGKSTSNYRSTMKQYCKVKANLRLVYLPTNISDNHIGQINILYGTIFFESSLKRKKSSNKGNYHGLNLHPPTHCQGSCFC